MRGTNGIWRALDRARAMNLAESGEAPAQPGREGVTRRRVIAALAGGAGLAAFPFRPALAQDPLRVAIVGGGLAGLTALDTLRARGADATLYEARNATGGRTRSVQGVFAETYAFDEGAQLVNTDHEDLLRLIRRFGIRMVDRRAFGPYRELHLGRAGALVAESRLASALRGIATRIAADSARLDADYEGVAPEIDALSVADYLDRHGLRPGDARAAIEASIRTEYGVEPHRASALELIYNLPTVEGRHVSLISTSDERYLVAGGTDRIATALASLHSDRIQTGRRLASVDLTLAAPRLTFADGEAVEADRVILALPPTLLREVEINGPLPPLWRELIAGAQLGRNEKVILGYDDSAAWRRAIGFGGAVWAAGDFAAIWDAVSLAPEAGPGALCYYLGGAQVDAARALDNAAIAARFTGAARRAIPGLPAPNGRIRRTAWCRDPLTQGAYINYRPGQMTRFASLFTIEEEGETRASQAGPLLFAGEWLSDAFPGYMNGAVQTGRIAAEAALAPVS